MGEHPQPLRPCWGSMHWCPLASGIPKLGQALLPRHRWHQAGHPQAGGSVASFVRFPERCSHKCRGQAPRSRCIVANGLLRGDPRIGRELSKEGVSATDGLACSCREPWSPGPTLGKRGPLAHPPWPLVGCGLSRVGEEGGRGAGPWRRGSCER